MKTTVLKYLLLDADVIIYLHEIGLWKAFIKRFEVFVSAAVANEVRFYTDNLGKHIPINLRNEKVKILEMDVNLVFCTGDGAAIIASCLLELKERIISLEEAMLKGGMKKNIKRQFTKQCMKKWKNKGETNLIQGVGLLKKKK